MDFKTTSTKSRAAFSVLELLISATLAAMVLAATASATAYTGRSFAAMFNYSDLDKMSRNALDTMSQQIRQTRRLIDGTSTRLVFEDSDGANLEFVYNSTNRTLTRIKAGEPSKVLLRNCDELNFSLFQRNPIGGTYNVYPTATPATCKLVQLRWTCSRDLIRSRVNTESVQSSKIVIRKQ